MPDEKDEIISDIGELQQYLRAISIIDGQLPRIVPTGVFDLETRRAIEAFQYQYGLPVTGDPDAETWHKIFTRYNYLITHHNHPLGVSPFSDTRTVIEANDHG